MIQTKRERMLDKLFQRPPIDELERRGFDAMRVRADRDDIAARAFMGFDR